MDTVKRSVVKTVFFKIITTGVTALFTGLSGAVKIHLILTAVYLIYERVWSKIKWGTILKTPEYELLRNDQKGEHYTPPHDGKPM